MDQTVEQEAEQAQHGESGSERTVHGLGRRSVLDALESWFFTPTDVRHVFLQRIGFGCIFLYYYARIGPNVEALYSPRGLGGYETLHAWPGFPGSDVGNYFSQFRLLQLVQSDALIWTLYALLLASAFCFAIGFFARTSGVLAIALHVVFSAHEPDISGGWVFMIHAFTLYVVLSNPGRAASVDAWLECRKGGATVAQPYVMSPWPTRIMRLHIVAMYMTAGIPRLVRRGWYMGETVFNAVSDTRFGRYPMIDWYSIKPLLTVLAYYAFVLEPLAVVLLLFRRTRPWCALGLMALHMGIEVLADVGMWQFTMTVALICFLPPRWLRSILPNTAPAPAEASR